MGWTLFPAVPPMGLWPWDSDLTSCSLGLTAMHEEPGQYHPGRDSQLPSLKLGCDDSGWCSRTRPRRAGTAETDTDYKLPSPLRSDQNYWDVPLHKSKPQLNQNRFRKQPTRSPRVGFRLLHKVNLCPEDAAAWAERPSAVAAFPIGKSTVT